MWDRNHLTERGPVLLCCVLPLTCPDRPAMGCPYSTVDKSDATGKAPSVAVPSQALQKDDRIGLSVRDTYRLSKSWKGIKRNMEHTGIEMFVRLFQENSDLKNLFRGFKDIENVNDMRENELFENHATLVMTTLDEAFSHLDNLDYVVDLLHRTGSTHVKFQGFIPTLFWHMEQPFLDAIKLTLGDAYTESIEEIYKLAIKFILQTLKDGMTSAQEENHTN